MLELGKKANKLSEFQKGEVVLYSRKHKESNELVKQCLKLFKHQWKLQRESGKKIYEQERKTLEKQLQVQEKEKFN